MLDGAGHASSPGDAMEGRVEELWSRFGLHNSVPSTKSPAEQEIAPPREISDPESYLSPEPDAEAVELVESETTVKSSMEHTDAWETQRQMSEELAEAREIRAQLGQQRDQIYSEVTERVQGIVESAIVRAQGEIADLKRHAIDEIKIVLKRIESLQQDAIEELKIQRILNDVDQLKATSEWMATSESSAFVEGGAEE
ncbi:MAG: hypothetical protein O3A33_12295 [Chloroflexi bacterium]|nr:hypothetical protein [Chloroflexota bacterium]